MNDSWIEALNRRAQRVGYEVIQDPIGEEVLPLSAAGIPSSGSMGSGEWCRIYRDGEPAFKFSWRAGEVEQWLGFREREAV